MTFHSRTIVVTRKDGQLTWLTVPSASYCLPPYSSLKLSLLLTPTSRWEVKVRDIWGPDGEPVKVKKVLAAAAAASEADTLR